MPSSFSSLAQTWISGIGLALVIFGGFYAFAITEHNERSNNRSEISRVCEIAEANKNKVVEIEKKLDGIHLIRAELLGLKSVMSSMDSRLERFEDYFLKKPNN